MPLFGAQRRLEGVEDDLRKTMTEVKALRVEWDETYEKLLKLYRKTAAERVKLEKASTPATEGTETPLTESGENGHGVSGFLTPKQKLIQQQILQRRGAMR